jgi:hypothetical protein
MESNWRDGGDVAEASPREAILLLSAGAAYRSKREGEKFQGAEPTPTQKQVEQSDILKQAGTA